MMKKMIACGMTIILTVSMTGCSLGGNKYKKASEKMIAAAENCCDAEEMSKSQKKKIIKNDLMTNITKAGESVYVTLGQDDLDKMDDDEDGAFSIENFKNVTIFMRNDEKLQGAITSMVFEMVDKDVAEELFDYYVDSMRLKERKKEWKHASEGEFAIDDESDDTVAFIASVDNYCMSGYIHIDGKIVTVCSFSGDPETDVLEEYYDFMREAGFRDMEALLEGDEED